MTMANDVAKQLESMIADALKETGAQASMSAKDMAVEVQASAARLSGAVGQAGYDEALRAERDTLALKAGLKLVTAADAADARVVGIVQGAIGILVAAL